MFLVTVVQHLAYCMRCPLKGLGEWVPWVIGRMYQVA